MTTRNREYANTNQARHITSKINAPVKSHLIPSRQKLRIRVSEKPTNISTSECKSNYVQCK